MIIKATKSKYYYKKIDEKNGDMKKTWKIINELRGKAKTPVKPSFIINGELIQDRRKIANEFNIFFTSIAEDMNKQLASDDLLILYTPNIPNFDSYMNSKTHGSIYLSDCTASKIEVIINDFKNEKSSDIAVCIIKTIS